MTPTVLPAPWLALVGNFWRIVAAGTITGLIGFVALSLIVPPRFEASMTLAAVTTQRAPAISGALAGLSGLGLSQQGLSATPDLVAQLMSSRRVLAEVAAMRGTGGATIGARVSEGRSLRSPEIEALLRELVVTNVDKKTGLVALGVVHRDTALARQIAQEIVASTSRTFSSVLNAQAAAQRRGQEIRVDSMAAQLRRAEEALLIFQRNNRSLVAYAEVSLIRQSIERKISIASQAYQQAAAERESALARELEQTPALVIVDPLPGELRRVPRYAMVYTVLAALAGAGLIAVWFVLQALMARLALSEPQSYASVHALVARVPILRRLALTPPTRARS